jgi:HK97 family phage portal protein
MGLFRRAATLPPGNPVGGGRIRTATDGRDLLLNDPDGWEVDQPWLWWLGPAGSDGTGGPFGNPPPGADGSYQERVISTLPAAMRCTSLICDTIAGLPWHVVRGDYETLTTPDWIADPQALRIDGRVADPSMLTAVRLSAVEFWAGWVTAALWHGDGYVYAPVRDAAGAPKPPLWQLHPCDVTIDGGSYWVGNIELNPDSIIHLRGSAPYVKGHGTGVIDIAGADLGLAATLRGYASSVFTTGVPAGYLKSSAPTMTQADADALKARWLAQHGGSTRSIAVLNATTEFHPVSISPIDAQLSGARESSLRDVALAFGVPPYMLGVPGDSSTYANIESRQIELRTFSLLPWQRRIESTLDAQLVRGTSLKIRSDALLRADTATRYSAYSQALDHGWLTVDEVRALEDRPPLPAQSPPVA